MGSCAENRQLVGTLRPAQGAGMNTVSGRIVVTTDARNVTVAAATLGRSPVSVGNPKAASRGCISIRGSGE